MSAYEMMLSESQERMLMVLSPNKEEEAKAIFVKWGLDFAIVGKTTDDAALPSSCTRAMRSPTCRSRNWATKPRNMTAGWRRARSPVAARYRRCEEPDDYGQALLTCSARPTMPPPLGLGAV
jgi:hypothetical protein